MHSQSSIVGNHDYFDSLPADLYGVIYSYLDPISLSYLLLVNNTQHQFMKNNLIWKKMLESHFPNFPIPPDNQTKMRGRKKKKLESGKKYYEVYKKASIEIYRYMNTEEKRIYSLMVGRDVYTLTNQSAWRATFNFQTLLLRKFDAKQDLILLTLQKNQVINVNLEEISKKNHHAPILINQDGQMSIYGLTEEKLPLCVEYKNIEVNAAVFSSIKFPPFNTYKNISGECLTNEMFQEIRSKRIGFSGRTLLKEIQQYNCLELNNYIFSQLYDNHPEEKEKLIQWGIALNTNHYLFEKLLEEENIERLLENDVTLLGLAVSHYAAHAVEVLLKKGADPNALTEGVTPLFMAARNGDAAIVRLLLANNANPNMSCGRKQLFPLFIAAQRGHIEVVKCLCQAKVDVNAFTLDRYTALHAAIALAQEEVVAYLLEKDAFIQIGINDNQLLDILNSILVMNHFSLLEKILRYAQNKEQPVFEMIINGEDKGKTFLHCSVEKAFLGMTQLLFSFGAKLNKKTKDGATALMLAVQKGHVAIVSYLMQHDVKVNEHTFENGYTLLHAACDETTDIKKTREIIKLLIQAGMNPLAIAINSRQMKTPSQITKDASIQMMMYQLEEIAACTNGIFQFDYMLNQEEKQKVIDSINQYIQSKNMCTRQIFGYVLNDRESNKDINTASFCKTLIKHTEFSLAYMLILIAIMSIKSSLAKHLASSLWGCAVEVAKESLSNQLRELIDNDKIVAILDNNIIMPIYEKLANEKIYLTEMMIDFADYHPAMLCLDLLQAQMKQAILLKSTSQEVEDNRVSHKRILELTVASDNQIHKKRR